MIWNSLLTFAYPIFVYVAFGITAMWIAILAGIVSFLMLETINYIEHYGLRRKLLENGRYERVEAFHSWNSNHYVGRILLYELTRHSDHHYKAFKNYQILDHHDSSPQLPLGYPASMVIALIPFLWFRLMDSKIREG